MRSLRLFLVLAALSPGAAFAQERPVAVVGATILTGSGESLPSGVLVFRAGKIESVSAGSEVPEGAEVIDGAGLFLTPGFIDARSSFGLEETWDPDQLAVPERDVLESLGRPAGSDVAPWLQSGVTATFVSPGGENLFGGFGAVIKLNGTVVREQAAQTASFGETALEAFETPTTRQGMIAVLRQTLIRAEEDRSVDEGGRALVRVLRREVPLHVLANTPDDILTAIRVAGEFGIDLVLTSAYGAHEVASSIKEAGVPVIVGPSIVGLGDGGPFEAFAHTPANAATLAETGVRIALSTFSGGGRSVKLEAVMAKSHGLSEEAALRAVTADAAAILGVFDRIGTLESGKDADLVLWKGHPVGTWGVTERVIVDGVTVFKR